VRVDDGLTYEGWTYQDSRVHMLTVDLTKRELRPVMDKQAFPFNGGHPQTKAVEQGAVVVGPGGFNITLFHGFGIQDQPQHALVVDGEIWTTGLGAGGYGVLIGPDGVSIGRNQVQIHVWRADGTSFEVDHVNRGHEGEVVAFTPRGGTNEYPRFRGKRFYQLRAPISGLAPTTWTVADVQDVPPRVWPRTMVLEATYDLGLSTGDIVRWKQDLGGDGVRHIISGWPQVLRDGENILDEYEMDPVASHGPDAWMIRRNPRTAIGSSDDGKTAYLICVEGRLPNEYRKDAEKSRGLRLKALAETALKHDVANLVNMDGGGSAFQWTREGPVTWGCYNTSGTIEGQRRAHFSASVF